MKITLLLVGKTEEQYLNEGVDIYVKRLKHYIPFSMLIIPALKNTKHLSFEQQKSSEAELILKSLQTTDFVVLLDEKGKQMTSVSFSKFIEKQMNASVSNLVFVVGGPYGVDESIKTRANLKMSLSEMTFSHQMIRLFFTEQLYRAFSIMRGEPYHHQ